jgi:DNA-sulfur modification-associated
MKITQGIEGFLANPKKAAKGKIYRGRFICQNLQWTGSHGDLMGTFTITAEELADAAANGLLWTDQDVQRGIQPGIHPTPPRELNLGDGYPDTKSYVFQKENADNIAEKLLHGEKLFLNPLIWNLRPSHFEAYWDEDEAALFLYSGKIYLPDSHHRQQAIVKAVQIWRSSPKEYPRFSGSREFKIELYFLSREDEGNYFFDKNQRPMPTAKSKAYDITTLDDLSLLAKKVIDKTPALQDNVNRVTDRLTAKNPQVMTLSTLREMMKSFASNEELDASELDGLAAIAAEFYSLLASVRPELGKLDLLERRDVRDNFLVDAAVMMQG